MRKDTDDETMKELIRLAFMWCVDYGVDCVGDNKFVYLDPMTGVNKPMGRSWLKQMLVQDIPGLSEHDCEWILKGMEHATVKTGPIDGLGGRIYD